MIMLKELRKARKLTQGDVAHAINVSSRVYSNYELGQREPPIKVLVKLADYFGVSLDYLLRSDQPNYYEKMQGVRGYELTPDREELLMYYALMTDEERKMYLQLGKITTDKS